METTAVIASAAARLGRITLAGPGPGTGARRSYEAASALRCMSNDDSARRTHDGAQLD